MVKITVTDPQTESEGRKNKQQFTSYLVTSISESSSSSSNNNHQIRRRYSDFTWLYNRLQTEIPGAVVPIIPHERTIADSKKRLSKEFVERRRRQLQEFLSIVVQHPELSRAPSMTPFMLDKIGEEFTIGKKRIEAEFPTNIVVVNNNNDNNDSDTRQPSKAVSAIKGVSNMLARFRTSKDSLKTTPEEKDIELMKDYITKVESHVKPLTKAAETMTRLTGELAVTIGDIAQPIEDWKTTYQSKTLTGDQLLLQNGPSAVTSVGKNFYSTETKTAVVDMMSAIQEFSKDYSTLLLMKHKQEEESFEHSLQALHYKIRAFQIALKQRKHWQVSYTTTFQQVIDKEVAISKATKALKPPEVTGKLQDEKSVLDKKKEAEKEKFVQCSERLVKEFALHQPQLEVALKTAWRDYAKLQRSYTDRINDAWGQLLPFVEDDDDEKEATEEEVVGMGAKEEEEGFEGGETADAAEANGEGGGGEPLPPMPSAPPPPPPPPAGDDGDNQDGEGDFI